ncbi:MAG: DUF5320 domain-containing protein [Peptococcaceae bacterium]|nr:DUF5320 domain-containing protein [Peptococcaceae bacterium]
MPGGDRRGPLGYGPMTGRGAGFCAGYGMPGFTTAPGPGWGGHGWRRICRGPGWGRGWFAGWSAPRQVQPAPYGPNPQEEREWLKNQAAYLQEQLDFIQKRLNDIDKNSKGKDE